MHLQREMNFNLALRQPIGLTLLVLLLSLLQQQQEEEEKKIPQFFVKFIYLF